MTTLEKTAQSLVDAVDGLSKKLTDPAFILQTQGQPGAQQQQVNVQANAALSTAKAASNELSLIIDSLKSLEQDLSK